MINKEQKEKLLQEYTMYGSVDYIDVRYKFNGFAQVVFKNAQDAQWAQRVAHGMKTEGAHSFVSYYLPREDEFSKWSEHMQRPFEEKFQEREVEPESVESLLNAIKVKCEMNLDVRAAFLALANEADPRVRAECVTSLRALGNESKQQWDEMVAALEVFANALPALQV